jgi:hypothetical protein
MDRRLRFGALLIGATLAASPATSQVKRYDGTWSVEVVTSKGDCDRAYRYSVILDNGRARYGGPEGFDIRGQVQPNGAIRASIARGSNRADVTGRLSGTIGSGTWSATGGRSCSGTWNAEKQG